MSFLKRLFGGLVGGGRGGSGDDGAGRNAFWIYVRCNACGEAIRTRVHREHDLSAECEGDSDAPESYHASKEIVGQKCFRRIHVDLTFDRARSVTDRQITGGTFITREEYDAASAADAPAAAP